ncbi:MAG TPA: hypothetical protein DDZ51_31125 [Planctomycetaceae bacterium]|nr:hypothetical protein [Planctomycetaceae bacterium]
MNRQSSVHPDPQASPFTFPLRAVDCQLFVGNSKVLNGFCVVTDKHLDDILRIGDDWYNKRRGRTCRDHLPLVRDAGEPPVVDLAKHKLVCHGKLGGHLKSYRAAA